MGKKRKTGKKGGVFLTMLLLFCTFLTGCDFLDIRDGGLGMTNPDYVEPEEEPTTSNHTESPDSGESPKKATTSWFTESGKASLEEEQEWLRDYGAVFGAAFLGYTPDYSFPEKEYQRAETYPYLEGIPEDHIIEYTGDEWYVIVPAEEGWKMSIESCSWNDDFTESSTEDLLWESSDGLPLILRCNLSDLYSNVQVTARKGSREVSWHPYYLTYAGEIEPTDGVMQLLSGSYIPEEGYLYGMEGSWYCDSAQTDAGEPYFYSVTFMTGEDGYPLDMWYYGGLLDGEMEDIRFFWDGCYAYGDPPGESLEFWLNTPDGTRNGRILLELEGDCLTIHEMEGEAFFPFTRGSVEKFYLHPVAAAGENYDYSGNEMDVLLAQSEVQDRLSLGMAIRDVDGMETIRGEACVLFALGTEHPDQFVAEYYYAVSPSGLVYRMDYLTGEWEPI